MEMIKHELHQLKATPGQYALTVYLSAQDMEFANELGTEPQSQKSFLVMAKKIVKEHYPAIRVSVVNVMVGGFLITSLPFQTTTASAESNTTEQTVQTASIYYHVKSGDSLWTISRTYQITVDSIKRANQLAADALQPNQRLIIPKAFHTVQTGDYLSVIARDYNTPASAIREANGLTSDSVRLGQTLIIPMIIGGTQTKPAEQPTSAPDPAPVSNQTYTVKAGDSLSAIARDHGTTTEALRSANQLSSDVIRVGQVLNIPTRSTPEPTFKIQPIDEVYTVTAGDSLSVIAARFGTTVDALKSANSLTSNTLQIGQRLVIPNAQTTIPSPAPAQTSSYTVVAGDSLSVIASRFGVSVTDLRAANNLSSDLLRIGQVLTIPNGSAAPTNPVQPTPAPPSSYTVISGDSLSVIASRFGVSVSDLRAANNLSSDLLRIGQVLTIPNGSAAPTNPVQPSPAPPSSYTVVSGDSLSVIASRFGVSVSDLRAANNLSSDLLRIGQVLTIPNGSAAQPSPTSPSSYTVVSGDSLSVIASRFGVSVNDLRSANNLSSDLLRIGQVLTIPNGSAAQPSPTPPSSYTVVSGDSLSVIASRFGVSVTDLRAANNLSSDLLRIGQVLTIPNGSQAPSPAPATEQRTTFTYTVAFGDSLSVIANRYKVPVDSIRTANNLRSDTLQVGQRLVIPDALNAPAQTSTNTVTYTTHTVRSGDTIWDLSVQYGIPQSELLKANNLTTSSRLSVGQQLTIPVHTIAVKPVVSQKHGELLDWWTEAQYVFTIGKTAKVTDLETGKSFHIKRTIGANHADCETVTVNDTNIARSIWGGFSWTPRAVILEVDGRRLAASMSFMPHDVQYIRDNGITGHFDVYFSNSTRHADGRPDPAHQAQVERAAGVR